MFKKLKSHLTYANFMASIAIFIALGGGAYAATTLPSNSVGAKQLKTKAVTAAKIKNGVVSSAKVKDNSLNGADILEASLGTVPAAENANTAHTADAARTADSARTADTATKADSATTAASVANDSVGGNGLKGIIQAKSNPVSIAPGASASATAPCPAGTTVISGGSFWDVTSGILNTEGDLLHTTHSAMVGNGWLARGGNASGTARNFRAEAYCLPG